MKSIAIAGTILVDKINVIDVYPEKGKLVDILSVSKAVGGCVPNVAIDIKRLDKDFRVVGIGKVGKDSEGDFVISTLKENGVEVDGIKFGNATSFSEVMSVKGGERTFFVYAGDNSTFGVQDIDFDSLNVDMFHLGYFLLLDKVDSGEGVEILKKLQAKGIKTSIDLVSKDGGDYKIVRPALKYTDNIIINEIEAKGISGLETDDLFEISKALKELGVKERVIIHRPEYAVCLSNSGYTVVPSFELPKGFIQGSTGAGDAFCAGCLLGIAKGFSDKEILELSSCSAVCNLSKANSIDGMTSIENAKKLCAKFKRKNFRI